VWVVIVSVWAPVAVARLRGPCWVVVVRGVRCGGRRAGARVRRACRCRVCVRSVLPCGGGWGAARFARALPGSGARVRAGVSPGLGVPVRVVWVGDSGQDWWDLAGLKSEVIHREKAETDIITFIGQIFAEVIHRVNAHPKMFIPPFYRAFNSPAAARTTRGIRTPHWVCIRQRVRPGVPKVHSEPLNRSIERRTFTSVSAVVLSGYQSGLIGARGMTRHCPRSSTRRSDLHRSIVRKR
jgi:hypothetical protein